MDFRRGCGAWVLGIGLLAVGCGGDDGVAGGTDGATTGDTGSATGMSATSNPTTSASTSAGTQTSGSDTSDPDVGGGTGPGSTLCDAEPPPGAAMPPPLPTYEGMCPPLVAGRNTIQSSGNAREFVLAVPDDIQPGERLPVAFLWHWLGGDAQDFIDTGDVQTAANLFRFIAIAPESKDDLPQKWPYTAIDTDARFEEEYSFFDDMLACVAEQYPVNESCVSSVGVSAGALFTAQLASGRGQYLSSILSLSGGTGGVLKPWGGSDHVMPALVLWGGPDDFCVAIDFEQASQDLEAGLSTDGHFILECVHNCAHAAPPFDAPMSMTEFEPLWRFVVDHPYWLEDGESPWNEAGLPEGMPQWCAIGAGQATIREGECGPSQC